MLDPPKIMPIAVKRGLTLLLAMLGVALVRQLIGLSVNPRPTDQSPGDTLIYLIFAHGVSFFLLYYIYRGRHWARVVELILTLLSISAILMARSFGKSPHPSASGSGHAWVWYGVSFAQLAGSLLLFSPGAQAWFTQSARDESRAPAMPPVPTAFLSLRNAGTVISMVLFAAALTQTAFYQHARDPDPSSIGLFSIGWLGLLAGYFEWFANPLLVYSWMCALRQRYSRSAASAALALLVIVSFLRRTEVVWLWDNGEEHAAIEHYASGYWLWLASAALMFIASFAQGVQQKLSPVRPGADAHQ
jgi:hypothetical protein